MPKKPKVNEEDLAAFYKAMAGTTPLSQKKVRLAPKTQSRPPTKKVKVSEKELNFNETDELDEVSGEEFIAYKQASISEKILRKLRKGQYNVEAILDLHGMSVEQAKQAVIDFLQQCLHKGMRVVLIIHGKGRLKPTPILKNKLNHWLRRTDLVLAFCSAASFHGNRGALYVLLKRTEESLLE